MVAFKTHLDTTFAHQGVYFSILLLREQFSLNCVEIISLLCAHEYAALCSYYFNTTALLYIFAKKIRNQRGEFGSGVHFGWKFLELMRKVYVAETKSGKGSPPPRMYTVYCSQEQKCQYTWKEFLSLFVHRMIAICYTFTHYNNEPKKDIIESVYTEILVYFQKKAKQSGLLQSGHAIAITAKLGLLPAWLIGYRNLPYRNSVTMQTLAKSLLF